MQVNLSKLQEVPISKEVMNDLLASIPSDVVLVGGQALAFWVEHFNINPVVNDDDEVFVSRDADFLGRREHVKMLADVLSGTAEYPSRKAMTILCGQIFIVNKDENTFMNIDVIHRIGNMDSEAVRRRAVKVELLGKEFFVMHPLDVLISRIENFRGIPDKQTSNGLRQMQLAIEVARQYIFDLSSQDETTAIKAIEKIAETARSAAGSYARQNGVEIYDAIRPQEIVNAIKNRKFLSVRIPKLVDEIEKAKYRVTMQPDTPTV